VGRVFVLPYPSPVNPALFCQPIPSPPVSRPSRPTSPTTSSILSSTVTRQRNRGADVERRLEPGDFGLRIRTQPEDRARTNRVLAMSDWPAVRRTRLRGRTATGRTENRQNQFQFGRRQFVRCQFGRGPMLPLDRKPSLKTGPRQPGSSKAWDEAFPDLNCPPGDSQTANLCECPVSFLTIPQFACKKCEGHLEYRSAEQLTGVTSCTSEGYADLAELLPR